MPTLDPNLNPYGQQNPFDLLGSTPSASLEELRDAMEEKLEDLDDQPLDPKEKFAQRERINAAYDSVRKPDARFAVEMCLMDSSVGKDACRKEAQKHAAAEVDVTTLLGREDEVFPMHPPLGPRQLTGKQFKLEESTQLRESEGRLTPNPRVEAAQSITFDR